MPYCCRFFNKENILKIGKAGKYLLELINDTLDISKLEQKKLVLSPAPFFAEDFMQSLQDMLLPSMQEKKIEFSIRNYGVRTDVYAMGDELRLKQIFINLFSNAIKFTPEGGRITLTLRNRGDDGRLAKDQFIIEDTGVGMSEDFLQHGIFQPFSQEHNGLTANYAGSGLGLSIVKNLVELMNGSIRAESTVGKGTAFTIDLDFTLVPAEEVSAERGKAPAAGAQMNRLAGMHILLCEDNQLNTEIASKILENAGISVTASQNGLEAVRAFSGSAENHFDAVLMDIRMPVMDGLTAARRIRALHRTDAGLVPIIAMTANAYLEDKQAAKDAGMNAHLSKPINVTELYQTLLRLIPEK